LLTIIDRYVLKQVSVPLAASFGIGLMMLLAERLVRLLDTTLGKRNSFSVVFELLAYLVPHYLGTAIPAALFLGLLFGFSRLSKSQELDAMLAAGFGLHRLALPTLVLALIFAVASFAIFGWLQPYTRYAYRSVLYEIQNVDAFYLAEEGVFMQAGSRTFILDRLDRSTNAFERIFVFDERGKDGTETMTASDGLLIPVPGDIRPVLRLRDGNRLRVESAVDFKGAVAPAAAIGSFSTSDTPLGSLSKNLFRTRGIDERELTLTEIVQDLYTPPKGATVASMTSELHHRLVNTVIMVILPFLALPFSVGRARSPRAYRIGIALVILVAFHEIIEQGAVATKGSGISPFITMWLPLLCLAVFAGWRFYQAAFLLSKERESIFRRWFEPVWNAVAAALGRDPAERKPS
jgi:lipopolysaccharide export system permease protein